jgi:lipid-A-disaccharide synthase
MEKKTGGYQMHKIMFSAGEVSGDMHGASIAAAIKKCEPDARLFGFGGPQMESAGVEICCNMQDYNVMGFWEVIKNLRRMFKLRDHLIDVMVKEKPDILVLIDYPDFNWRLAAKAKKLGIPIFSYIPPSAWAWRKGRAKPVARMADQIAAIFPFETKVYEDAGAKIEFVGNPLVDTVKPSMEKADAAQYFSLDLTHNNVLLLPGSRKQEIQIILPEILKAAEALARQYDNMDFYLPIAPGISKTELTKTIKEYNVRVHIKTDHTYDLMNICDFAIATSGTVTLEAAMIGLPSVILYKMSPISYFIGNFLVHLPNFSLPNIIAGERILPEFLQAEISTGKIVEEAEKMFKNTESAAVLKEKLKLIRQRLGQPDAAARVAALILNTADRCKDNMKDD